MTTVSCLSGLVIFLLYFETVKALGGHTTNKLLLILPSFGLVSAFFVTNDLITVLLLLIILSVGFYPRKLRWFRLVAFLYIFVSQYLFLRIICEIPSELNIQQPLFLLVMVISSDTGGYVFGRFFGKKRLAPKISPNKTWEGCLGSILLAISSWFFFFRGFGDNLIIEIILVIIVCTCAQIGDLVESYAKRRLAIKDSGGIIPGHGGIFDRVDSILGATFGYSLIIALGFGF